MAKIELDLTDLEAELYLSKLEMSISIRTKAIKNTEKSMAYLKSVKNMKRAQFYADLIIKMNAKLSVEQRMMEQLQNIKVGA